MTVTKLANALSSALLVCGLIALPLTAAQNAATQDGATQNGAPQNDATPVGSPAAAPAAPAAQTAPPRTVHWPSFRGPDASGVVDGQHLPDHWSAEDGTHLRWKQSIPGLSHASPVIWGDRLFVTSAVNARDEDPQFKPGLYGDGTTASDRDALHRFVLYALDKHSGEILWQRTAYEGVPKAGRHIKATYANSSPVTDGETVVAFFASQGVHAFTVDGEPKWSRDLGVLISAAYNAPDYEWGMASSPIIFDGMAIVQADTITDEDFLIALDLDTGKTVWRTERDELPSWGTPTVYPHGGADGKTPELVTNASNFIQGYDPYTGKELWRLGGSSQITAPTPVFQDDILIVASGRRPEKPIFALRPGPRGDITLAEGQTSSENVLWSRSGDGPYMPTPLIYGDYLYSILNQGILDCYDLRTGERYYRERLHHRGGGFSASPVAADGRLYLASEDGDVFVIKTGPEFEQIATNPMGEVLMATPALSEGTLYVRGRHHVFAVGREELPAAGQESRSQEPPSQENTPSGI